MPGASPTFKGCSKAELKADRGRNSRKMEAVNAFFYSDLFHADYNQKATKNRLNALNLAGHWGKISTS